ncbi:MAG: CotH kinase family protein, partial [Lachnospiraceae bacterium]|nr:CotH kinase family protein [Lachnospiraceae bacterium]
MRRIYKKGLSLICALGLLTTAFSNVTGYFSNGITANAAETITISTVEDLQKIGKVDGYPLSGDYVLGADIDMSGVDFTPIGGGVGTRGAASGNNVFTGTFDGDGHVISNLTIYESGNDVSDSWQYGLFGMIGSSDDNDYASVKNLILTGVDISVDMTGSGYLSLGALAGEVNHNAIIDNVAVVNGTIEGNPSNGGDVVGVGGLIGEMRYSAATQGGRPGQQTTAANGVSISNVYVGADVVSGSSTGTNYTAGIIGRVAKTNPTAMTACVYTGNASFKGSNGYGITGGEMTGNISNCYYISGMANTGMAVSEEDLMADTLLTGLADGYWTAGEGSYMMLNQCIASEKVADILALSSLSLELAEGDSLSAITGDFTVPTSITIGDTTEGVVWTSSSEVLTIGEDGAVTVNEVFTDTECILTATTESGKTKEFFLTILTKVAVKIEQEYATIGEPLTAVMTDAPEDLSCTYEWYVDEVLKSTEASYTPSNEDLEKMLTVVATASGEYAGTYFANMYISKLPVVYVNTEGGADIVSKEDYLNGELKIQGNASYNTENTTLYDGIMEIRGRGNTTWGYPKKPYKIKLDEKTDLFGFGSNKHWVLLANYTDEAHMRNMLSYDLAGKMGMPYMQSVHVDLILNGEYKGTYQFCEQVKISKARVNIHDWEDYAEDVAKAIYKVEKDNTENPLTKDDRDEIETILAETDMSWMTTGTVTYNGVTYTVSDYIEDVPAATGGFLMELDAYYDEVSKFTSGKNQPLMFKSPEFIATNADVMNYVADYINAFEKAIDASDFTTTYNNETLSYSQLFDMDSLVQFWLVQELFNNVDAMKKSTYMYKDIDGKFYMGPIWDMDWSSNSLVSQSQSSGTYNAWQTVKFSDAAQANQW